MIRLTDRLTYEATYRVILPGIATVSRLLPTRCVMALANRADRREAAARYADGMARVGVLRRFAIDRYDARADANVTYYLELRRRNEARKCCACNRREDGTRRITITEDGTRLCGLCDTQQVWRLLTEIEGS